MALGLFQLHELRLDPTNLSYRPPKQKRRPRPHAPSGLGIDLILKSQLLS